MRVPFRKSVPAVPATVLAALAALLLVTTAPAAQADGPGVGHAVGRERRRLLHLRRGRALGRQLQHLDVVRRRARRARPTSTTPPAPPSRSTAATAARPPRSYVGGGVSGLNLACSGAKTSTFTDSDGYFKPGLDFYDDGAGHHGQAKMLQQFAATHNVKMVAVSIGGNDFNFGSIVQQCVTDFLTSPTWCEGLLQGRQRRSPPTSPRPTSPR